MPPKDWHDLFPTSIQAAAQKVQCFACDAVTIHIQGILGLAKWEKDGARPCG